MSSRRALGKPRQNAVNAMMNGRLIHDNPCAEKLQNEEQIIECRIRIHRRNDIALSTDDIAIHRPGRQSVEMQVDVGAANIGPEVMALTAINEQELTSANRKLLAAKSAVKGALLNIRHHVVIHMTSTQAISGRIMQRTDNQRVEHRLRCCQRRRIRIIIRFTGIDPSSLDAHAFHTSSRTTTRQPPALTASSVTPAAPPAAPESWLPERWRPPARRLAHTPSQHPDRVHARRSACLAHTDATG